MQELLAVQTVHEKLSQKSICKRFASGFTLQCRLQRIVNLSSAEWILDKPPSNFIDGHESTMWAIARLAVWVSATGSQVLRVC